MPPSIFPHAKLDHSSKAWETSFRKHRAGGDNLDGRVKILLHNSKLIKEVGHGFIKGQTLSLEEGAAMSEKETTIVVPAMHNSLPPNLQQRKGIRVGTTRGKAK